MMQKAQCGGTILELCMILVNKKVCGEKEIKSGDGQFIGWGAYTQ